MKIANETITAGEKGTGKRLDERLGSRTKWELWDKLKTPTEWMKSFLTQRRSFRITNYLCSVGSFSK